MWKRVRKEERKTISLSSPVLPRPPSSPSAASFVFDCWSPHLTRSRYHQTDTARVPHGSIVGGWDSRRRWDGETLLALQQTGSTGRSVRKPTNCCWKLFFVVGWDQPRASTTNSPSDLGSDSPVISDCSPVWSQFEDPQPSHDHKQPAGFHTASIKLEKELI